MAPVVHALREEGDVDVRVVVTAQHRALLDRILAFFDVPVDVDLDLMEPGQTLAGLMGRMLPRLDEVFAREAPEVVMAQGDTSTVLAAAMAAFYRRVPFAHVEAGLRTGDLGSPFPEEMNRVVAGRLAAWHFAPTEAARANLLREGVDPARVVVTGNTVVDALLWARERVDVSAFAPVGGRRLVLVTAHRRENFGAPMAEVCQAVRELAARGDVEVVFPVHPNPQVREVVERVLAGVEHVRLVAPLDYPEFVAAMQASHLILTDSGGVQEEAPSLGKPVLVLRESTERPEGVAAGTARVVGTSRTAIVTAATALLDDPRAYASMAHSQNPYGDGRAAVRMVRELKQRCLAPSFHFALESETKVPGTFVSLRIGK